MNESKIERTPQQYDCECERVLTWLRGACQVQLSVPAMQVTSSHVSIWYDFLASYDEYTALVKFGNVASEHVKSAISVVQPQLSAAQQKPSAVQQNRVGALVTHHLAWMSHHTSGSWQGHPRYNRCPTVGRPWVARSGDQPVSSSSTHEMQKLFNIFYYFSFFLLAFLFIVFFPFFLPAQKMKTKKKKSRKFQNTETKKNKTKKKHF